MMKQVMYMVPGSLAFLWLISLYFQACNWQPRLLAQRNKIWLLDFSKEWSLSACLASHCHFLFLMSLSGHGHTKSHTQLTQGSPLPTTSFPELLAAVAFTPWDCSLDVDDTSHSVPSLPESWTCPLKCLLGSHQGFHHCHVSLVTMPGRFPFFSHRNHLTLIFLWVSLLFLPQSMGVRMTPPLNYAILGFTGKLPSDFPLSLELLRVFSIFLKRWLS